MRAAHRGRAWDIVNVISTATDAVTRYAGLASKNRITGLVENSEAWYQRVGS